MTRCNHKRWKINEYKLRLFFIFITIHPGWTFGEHVVKYVVKYVIFIIRPGNGWFTGSKFNFDDTIWRSKIVNLYPWIVDKNHNDIRIPILIFGCLRYRSKVKKPRSNPFGGQNWKKSALAKRKWKSRLQTLEPKVGESSKIIYLEYTWIIFELVLSNSVLLSQCTFDVYMIWIRPFID